jgi:hypothetical protein
MEKLPDPPAEPVSFAVTKARKNNDRLTIEDVKKIISADKVPSAS